jgi:F-type H+-transporting ATPase subunit epsilon
MAQAITLKVVTPEKSIVSNLEVETVVLPGDLGQMAVLPGHINFISPLKLGSFAYKVGGAWSWAYLTGGFAQVYNGVVTVLAETLQLSQEIVLAEAELELQNAKNSLKGKAAGSAEYMSAQALVDLAEAKIATAKKQIH